MSKRRTSRAAEKLIPASKLTTFALERVEVEAIDELSASANKHASNAQALALKAQGEAALAQADEQRAQGVIQIAARRRGINPASGNWIYENGCLRKK